MHSSETAAPSSPAWGAACWLGRSPDGMGWPDDAEGRGGQGGGGRGRGGMQCGAAIGSSVGWGGGGGGDPRGAFSPMGRAGLLRAPLAFTRIRHCGGWSPSANGPASSKSWARQCAAVPAAVSGGGSASAAGGEHPNLRRLCPRLPFMRS